MQIDPTIYTKVRENAGLFNATGYYGRLFARGKDAIDLLHRMSTNELKPLEAALSGSALTFLTNEKGRIVDLLSVIRDEKGDVMLVTSAGREAEVAIWLEKYTIMEDARFIAASDQISQLALTGPLATEILSSYTDFDLSTLAASGVIGLELAQQPVTLVRTSQVAGGEWWILTATESSEHVMNELEAKVVAAGGALVDGALREILRIEHGVPKAPNELNDKHNPLETRLANDAVSFTKGCYIGQEVIARLDAQGKVQRTLVGLQFGDFVPHIGDRITDDTLTGASPLGDEIGEVTSVGTSPAFGNIGLGYVRAKHAMNGAAVSVKGADGNRLSATLVTLPFDV